MVSALDLRANGPGLNPVKARHWLDFVIGAPELNLSLPRFVNNKQPVGYLNYVAFICFLNFKHDPTSFQL